MILDLIDTERTPDLSEFDRGVLVLYSLAVTNRPQLAHITGWDGHKIDSLLKRLRKREQAPGEWLIRWQPRKREPYCYTLGPAAIRHAKELRREYVDDELKPVGAQAAHYLLTNEVLIRLLESDLEVEAWHGPRETGLWFYHEMTGQGVETDPAPKIRPDAVVEIGAKTFALEIDLATIPTPRMRARMAKYLTLAGMLPTMPDLVFIATTELRRRALARCLDRVMAECPDLRPSNPDWTISFLLPGEVPGYLAEWVMLSGSGPSITRVK